MYTKSSVRKVNNSNANKHYSFTKNKKKFKPKYDSRIRLVKQRTILKQRAKFASSSSSIQKPKPDIINGIEIIPSTFHQSKTMSNNDNKDKLFGQSIVQSDKDVSVKSTSSFESQSIRSNKKLKFTKTDKKSNRDKSCQPIDLKEQSTLNNSTKEIWFDDVPKALIDNSLQDQSATTKSLVKLTSFTGPTRRIAMDCEFVGVGYEGKDDALARVSIVNQFGHTLFDAYVRPEERVVDYRTKFSGIRPRDLRKNGPARSFSDVHKEVAELIKNKILIGHSILKDLKVLRLSHPRRFIRDTSRYRPFRDLFNGRIPSLKALTQKVLGVNVQIGEHDSVEDARATMRLYTSVKRIWESSKKQRISMMKQTKNNNKQKNTITAEKQIVLNAKDEYESGLQETISNHSPKQSTTTASSTTRRTSHQPKPWDPKRARKCSKNRVKFLNRRRKQHQQQQQHKNK